MEDAGIIELYHRRDERAIRETDIKHGSFCRVLAMNILQNREDTEECVSDTYLAAWNAMPPERPRSLRAFLGRITRNISVSLFRKNRAAKRYAGLEVMLSELDECVPDAWAAREAERRELADALIRWLDGLSGEDRALFLRRYWYGDEVKSLARALGVSPDRMARRMQGLRRSLKDALEKEDIFL